MPFTDPSRSRPVSGRALSVVATFLATAFLAGCAGPASAQTALNALRNGGFERQPVTEGEVWRPIPGDFGVAFDPSFPHEGQISLRLDREAFASSPFAAVAQVIDATPYRGRTIRFRAAARAALKPGAGRSGAGLWLRVDREGGAPDFFDNMHDRPIRSLDWTVYEISGPVAADADRITAGFLLNGAGSAWIDAASLEVLPDLPASDTSSSPPSERALRNLEAFAKLYGYVRWFSAASDPADPQWTVIAVEGARDVEMAPSDDDLAIRLHRWFEPMAPGLVVGSVTGARPAPGPGDPGLVRWRHTGVEFGNAAYRSARTPTAETELWSTGLVDGLPVSMPVTAVGPERSAPAAGAVSGLRHAPEDRAIRLGGLVIAWNVFRHFYPYFGDDGREWDQSLSRWLADAAAAPDGPRFITVLERMVADLDDGHGEVGPRPRAFSLPLAWQVVEGVLVVTGLPSAGYAGLNVGDVVLAVDGRPSDGLMAEEQSRVSASTPDRRAWRAAERILLRESSAPVELEVEDADGRRRMVSVQPVRRPVGAGLLGEPRPAPITWLPAGAWYFDLTRLDDAALTDALDQVRPGQAVIFDLRGYPQGIAPAFLGRLSDSDVATPPFRIPVAQLPEGRFRTWETVGWSVPSLSPRIRGRVAFLTDARAISYAETLLAMVAGHSLGDIVGSATAGTNGNVNPLTLPGGIAISWTGMEVVNHDGTPLHGYGVQPTVPVRRTLQGVRAGLDEVLARGLEVVARSPPPSGSSSSR